MKIKILTVLALLAASLTLSGCLEETSQRVTLAQPGIYLGPADELVGKGSQRSVLSPRLEGQFDR